LISRRMSSVAQPKDNNKAYSQTAGDTMPDVHTKAQRSYNMSRIRSKNTKPEELVRLFLFAHGYRYRKNDSRLPGKPDIVLRKYNTAVFVHGCFWHGHEGCRYYVEPVTNTDYWRSKIQRNRARDKDVANSLKQAGWNVLIIWECNLRKNAKQATLDSLLEHPFLKK